MDNTPNLYLPDGASPYLRNARLDGNTVHIRKGHRLFETLSSVGKGLGTYLRSDEFYDRLNYINEINNYIKDIFYDITNIKLESNFKNDFGLTSFDFINLICLIEDKFGVEIEECMYRKLNTVDLFKKIMKLLSIKQKVKKY